MDVRTGEWRVTESDYLLSKSDPNKGVMPIYHSPAFTMEEASGVTNLQSLEFSVRATRSRPLVNSRSSALGSAISVLCCGSKP